MGPESTYIVLFFWILPIIVGGVWLYKDTRGK